MIDRPPRTLQAAGKDLWRAVLTRYELDDAERALLELACHARDDAERARTDLKAGVTVDGRWGPRAHPAVAIARQAEGTVSKILGQLGVIDRSDAPIRHASTPGPKPTRTRR